MVGNDYMRKLLFFFIIFILILSLVACFSSSNKVEEKTEIDWNTLILHEWLPLPETLVGETGSNLEHALSVSLYDVPDEQFATYVQACIDKGYIIEAEQDDSFYTAFNSDGYEVRLVHQSDMQFNIFLDAPEEMTQFNWPTSGLGKELPATESTYGKICFDNEDTFIIHVGNTNIKEMSNYISECKKIGYNNNITEDEKFFNAYNSTGNELQIMYLGYNNVEISLKIPENPTVETEDIIDNNLPTENSPENENTSSENLTNENITEDNNFALNDQIILPYCNADYCSNEWTKDLLIEHFEELGFTNIKTVAQKPNDENYMINIFSVYISTSLFDEELCQSDKIYNRDDEITIYYNEFPLLTMENCPDLKTILTSDDISYMTFSERYDGRYIEFDGYVFLNTNDYATRIINVTGGEYNPDNEPLGLIIRFGTIHNYSKINEEIWTNTNCKVVGIVDASWSEYYDMLYIEGVSLEQK